MNPLLKRSDMARDSKGITQFYLPPTHEPYLPLLPSRRASPPFGWYSLRLPTEGWPGWVDLGDWLYTEIDFLAPRIEPRTRSPICSTNRARRRLTSLIETNALTTTPNRQPVAACSVCVWPDHNVVCILFTIASCSVIKQLYMYADAGTSKQ